MKVYQNKPSGRLSNRMPSQGCIAHHLRNQLDINAVLSDDQAIVTVGHRQDGTRRQ